MTAKAVLIEVAKLELKPGDILVLKVWEPSQSDIAGIARAVRETFPGVRILVIGPGDEISKITKGDAGWKPDERDQLGR